MKLGANKYALLTSLLMAMSAEPALCHGCNSSLFSDAGHQRFFEFVVTSAISYLLLLFTKTALLTWFHHRSNLFQIAWRSILGTLVSLALGVLVSFYAYLNLVYFFNNPIFYISLLVLVLSSTTTLSDSFFALNWQRLGYKQVGLSLVLNLLINCLSIFVIYLLFFANLKQFMY